jgi:hypothetical protein
MLLKIFYFIDYHMKLNTNISYSSHIAVVYLWLKNINLRIYFRYENKMSKNSFKRPLFKTICDKLNLFDITPCVKGYSSIFIHSD